MVHHSDTLGGSAPANNVLLGQSNIELRIPHNDSQHNTIWVVNLLGNAVNGLSNKDYV